MAGTAAPSDQIRQLSSYFGSNVSELATVVGTDDFALDRSGNEATLQRESKAILASLIQLEQRLGEMFGSHEGVLRWLHGPSGYFGGKTPFDFLVKGEIDRVNVALDAVEAGVFV